jgi:ABC-2 type transport system permease protein
VNWQPVAGIVLRQLYLLRGSPVRLVSVVLWGAIDIVLWGFITRYLNQVSGSGINFVATLLGAVLLWDISSRIMTGVSTAFLEDVWSRNFLNLFAAPLSIFEYVTGLVIASIVTGGLGLIVMLIIAVAFFGLQILVLGSALAAFVLILFVFGVTLGVLASAMVLRFGPASEWLVWPLPAMLAPFAGVFYPIAILPAWMQSIAHLLPPAYVFAGVRQILAARPLPTSLLVEGLALGIAELALAMLCYVHVYRRAVRSGLLARYSAESPG